MRRLGWRDYRVRPVAYFPNPGRVLPRPGQSAWQRPLPPLNADAGRKRQGSDGILGLLQETQSLLGGIGKLLDQLRNFAVSSDRSLKITNMRF